MTVGQKLDSSRGIAPGFDFLRVALALTVISFHSFFVIDQNDPIVFNRLAWLLIYAVLPMFFGLSGFLVAGSAERLSTKNFLINRGLRMAPALTVEIMASAFVVGAIFTVLPLHAYLTSPETWRYFTNVVGKVNFTLPGVFLNLPSKGIVNSSLWTIPWEYLCYVIMTGFMVTGLIRRGFAIGLLVLGLAVAGLGIQAGGLAEGHTLLAKAFFALSYGDGGRLILFFLAGVVAYQMRHKLPYGPRTLLAAVAICVAVAAFMPAKLFYAPITLALTIAPLTYLMVFVGVSPIPKLPLFHRGDYSYGIYLYGFPIQQSVQAVLHLPSAWMVTLVAAPLITLFAAFSWHCIEKPVLKLRKKFSFVAKVRLNAEEMAEGSVKAPPASVAGAPSIGAGEAAAG